MFCEDIDCNAQLPSSLISITTEYTGGVTGSIDPDVGSETDDSANQFIESAPFSLTEKIRPRYLGY